MCLSGRIWSRELCSISRLLPFVGSDKTLTVLFGDRIIYPHSYPEFLQSGKTEQDLMNILTAVNLAYLPAREGGWSTRKEWRDVLSGGEKQRVSCRYRLFSFMSTDPRRWVLHVSSTTHQSSPSSMVRIG